MATLVKDMQTLSDNTTMHKASLKELAYHWIVALYDQLEMWTTYIRDKSA
jgi:hypothetical protein